MGQMYCEISFALQESISFLTNLPETCQSIMSAALRYYFARAKIFDLHYKTMFEFISI